MLYQGFVLVFYIEASSSYFILRLRPRILFEASSSYFILRLWPRIILNHLYRSYRGDILKGLSFL